MMRATKLEVELQQLITKSCKKCSNIRSYHLIKSFFSFHRKKLASLNREKRSHHIKSAPNNKKNGSNEEERLNEDFETKVAFDDLPVFNSMKYIYVNLIGIYILGHR